MLKELSKWRALSTLCALTLIIIIGTYISYMANAYIGKTLNPSKFGDYKIILNMCILAGTLLTLGLDISLIKYIPPLMKRNKIKESYALFYAIGKVILVVILSFVLFNLFFISILLLLTTLHIIPLPKIHDGFYYLIFSGSFSLFFLITKFLRAIGYIVTSSILVYSKFVILLFLLLAIKNLSIFNAFLANISSYIMAGVITFLIILYKFKSIEILPKKIERKLYKESFLYNVQQLISDWRIAMLIFIMAILPRTKHEVGILASLMSLTTLSLISVNVLKTLFPNYVSQNMQQPTVVIRHILNTILIVSLGFTIIISSIIYLMSGYLLSFYGDQYQSNSILVFLAIFANLPIAFNLGHHSYLLFHEKGNIYLTRLLVVGFILFITITVIFTSYWGIVGSICAYIIAISYSSLGAFIGARVFLYKDAKLEKI